MSAPPTQPLTASYTPLADWMQPYDSNASYGFFGYRGYGIEQTLRRDDPAAIQECHRRGWIDANTVTLTNTPLRTHADRIGAKKVAAALATLGYPA